MFKTIKVSILSFILASFIIPSISFAQTSGDVDTSGGSSSSCITIDNNISYKNRKNNNKDDVTNLQDFLNGAGYLSADSVTGFFGKLTESAVAKFQSNNGLVATPPGFVGVGTRAKIHEVSCNGNIDKVGVATTPSTSSYQGQTGYTSNLPEGCKPGARFSYLTGISCDTNINNLPQGCRSVSGYSPVTGTKCSGESSLPLRPNFYDIACNSEQYLENGICKNLSHTCPDGRVIAGMLSCDTNAVTQSINITSPNGGEIWNIGGTYNINYQTTSNQSYYVYLEKGYPAGSLKTGVNSGSLLGTTTPGLSSFSYTIPQMIATWPGVGDNYKITLCSTDSNSQIGCPSGLGDTSDNYFTIATQVDSAPPAITTTTLPSATVGVPYTGTIVSVGGTGTRDWNTTGTLPPGLYLNKVEFLQGLNVTGSQPAEIGFVGAPTTVGTYTFTTKVTTGSQKASKQLTIVVNPFTVNNTTVPAPTVLLSTPSISVISGQSATISWSSTNATYCNSVPSNSSPTASGNTSSSYITGPLTSAFTFTVTCNGAGGSIVKSITIPVIVPVVPAPSVSLSVSPTSVTSGQSTTVTWSATNVNYCTLTTGSIDDYGAGSAPLSGSKVVGPLTSTSTVSLACPGKNGTTAYQSLIIPVTPIAPVVLKPKITSLTMLSGMLKVGDTADINFSSENTNYCHLYMTPPNSAEITLTEGYFSSKLVTTSPLTTSGSYRVVIYCWDKTGAAANQSTMLTVTASVGYGSINTVSYTPTIAMNSNQTGSQSPTVLGDFISTLSCTVLSRNLIRGSESSFVTKLQNFLAQKGFLSDTNRGFYGDKTVEAVKDYQASKGLPITGMVYDFTRQAIKAESCR